NRSVPSTHAFSMAAASERASPAAAAALRWVTQAAHADIVSATAFTSSADRLLAPDSAAWMVTSGVETIPANDSTSLLWGGIGGGAAGDAAGIRKAAGPL
ncbi:hypothetical protein Agub_g15249, partial [Astrephomene gubernaculifera]